jgi:hypothetical protein
MGCASDYGNWGLNTGWPNNEGNFTKCNRFGRASSALWLNMLKPVFFLLLALKLKPIIKE